MASQPETKYFMLDAASIPSADECGAANDRMKYAKKLRSMAKTSGPDGTCETAMGVDEVGFAKGSAATVAPISLVKDIDISIRLFIFFTSFLWIPGLIIYFTLIIPTLFGWVMVGITVLLYFAPPRWLPKARFNAAIGRSFLYRNFFPYASIKIIWEEGFDLGSGPYLFNAIPHGYLPLPVATSFGLLGDLLGTPTSDLRIGTASFLHRIPFIRHVISFMGCIPASPGAIKAYLKKGWNVAIVTDGIAGMFHIRKRHEYVFYKARKGFAKMAIITGTPVVPMYSFGISRMFHIVNEPTGILEKISRKIRFPILLFWGRFGLWIALRVPQTIALGKPIPVKKNETPTQEEIDALHQKIMDETTRLFNTHKKAYGWEGVELKFV